MLKIKQIPHIAVLGKNIFMVEFFHPGVTRRGLGPGFKVHCSFLFTAPAEWDVLPSSLNDSSKTGIAGNPPRLHICCRGPLAPQLSIGCAQAAHPCSRTTSSMTCFGRMEQTPSALILTAARKCKHHFASTGALPITLQGKAV